MPDELPVPKRWKLAAPEFGEQKDRRRNARNGIVCGVLIWDYEEAEGEVLLHPNFFYGSALEAADAIQDWSGLLDREYNAGFPVFGQRRKNKTEGGEDV
jgi:hypothetical protein